MNEGKADSTVSLERTGLNFHFQSISFHISVSYRLARINQFGFLFRPPFSVWEILPHFQLGLVPIRNQNFYIVAYKVGWPFSQISHQAGVIGGHTSRFISKAE
jgi:hypothetical protein